MLCFKAIAHLLHTSQTTPGSTFKLWFQFASRKRLKLHYTVLLSERVDSGVIFNPEWNLRVQLHYDAPLAPARYSSAFLTRFGKEVYRIHAITQQRSATEWLWSDFRTSSRALIGALCVGLMRSSITATLIQYESHSTFIAIWYIGTSL